MSVNKSWLCTLCHRSGDETTMADAELRHVSMLLATKYHNAAMGRTHKGWVGPSHMCAGHIVMREMSVKEKKQKGVQGTFLDESGDTWVEIGARMKVSGKVEER